MVSSKFGVLLLCAVVLVNCPLFVAQDSFYDEDPTCMLMLESFANLTATYTYCTISHARPITLCQTCVNPYLKVLNIYDDITKIENMGGQKCESELANLDRLQVFESGYKYVTDLWSRANCDTCFVADPMTNRPTTALTDVVTKILNASSIHKECIAKYHNASITPDLATCELCVDSYDRINDIYNGYKIESGGIDYCMDIVDLINNTRSQWSDSIGCCQDRDRPEWIYLTASLGIGLLPVLFYLGVYTLTPKKRHSSNHGIVNIANEPSISGPPSEGDIDEEFDRQDVE